ncbi:MAG: 16S rRNA (cytosine(1402)-N(4))-methyltransferase RsmH [Planctomycetota bacterium]
MTTEPVGHHPVLLRQVLGLLAPQPGETVVDATLGRGGHAAAVLPLIPGGRYLGTDADADNAAFARSRLEPLAAQHGVTLTVVHQNFAGLRTAMDAAGLDHADALLADLGFASNQVDDPGRGLSFQGDGPLDMRLDASPDPATGRDAPTAADLLQTLPERELADLIYRFGEERLSRRIARWIVEHRGDAPIRTTAQLADLCRRAYGPAAHRAKIHPATRTFQALRIAVNGELDALDSLLRALPGVLAPGGRAAVISFHSLEDRPVKQTFLRYQQDGHAQRLTRKPLTAEPDELAANPRSRSAKLRGLRWGP